MDIIKLHKITVDDRSNKVRLLEIQEHYPAFLKKPNLENGLIVMKNCLSLVNDVMEYSQPIRMDEGRFSQCKYALTVNASTIDRFYYDCSEYLKHSLLNDLAPRFYCKQWFTYVVTVLEMAGWSLESLEREYQAFISGRKQLSLF